ncbi:MAG: rhomboid family intramembrane serine protease [Flavicella sp.]|nr:rhomboid family intramembrane serine protease [Flavicella sp.]
MNGIVVGLIVANVVFSYKGITEPSFLNTYKFQIAAILRGERMRMLSSGFLHVDYLHLGFNMYALYLFASPVLGTLGNVPFLILYFGSLLLGNVFTLFYHKNESYYSAVGASGAVSGIVYSAIVLYPEMTLYLFPLPVPIPGYLFGIGYLLYSMYGMKKQLGSVGHSAHLGGAVGGFFITILLYPQVLVAHKTLVILLAVPILLLFLFGKNSKQ